MGGLRLTAWGGCEGGGDYELGTNKALELPAGAAAAAEAAASGPKGTAAATADGLG